MKIPIYQVDAFADRVFRGNPAAVCPLEAWLPVEKMQSIANENNLSETAFFIPYGDGFKIRWFTPESEVDLCGHATLATAYVLFHHLKYPSEKVEFHSRSGILSVFRGEKDLLRMDFPAFDPIKTDNNPAFEEIFGLKPVAAYRGNYLMLLFEHEEEVRSVQPDFKLVKSLDEVGVIITSRGMEYDFVSRFFAPMVGIDEDPVTGSAHSSLTPFWAKKLHKEILTAYQCSTRGGILYCEYRGDRVIIGGRSVTYMEGIVYI
jgi:PhzF family phenazine biosynthesis protein